MQITAGPTTQRKENGANTLAFDCAGGNLLVVLVGEVQGTYGSFGDGTCTYDAAGMDNAISAEYNDGSTYGQGVIFYIENPASGSNNIIRTPSDVWVDSGICAIAFSGWSGKAPTVTSATYASTVDIASQGGGYVLDALCFDALGAITAGAGQTKILDIANDVADEKEDSRFGGSREAGDGSTITMSWNRTFHAQAVASFGGGGGNKMILMMSEIYDRIQKNRKKVGVGDLGNFGLNDGLWKPKQGLATI